MLTFEQAAEILDEAADALPEELLEGLTGGISLLPDKIVDEEGFYIMGRYFRDGLGRYIELYYGSFESLYRNRDDEWVKERLIHTLHHELTHHIEGRAGETALEREDEAFREDYMAAQRGDPVYVDSILFVDEDDCSLAPMAAAMMTAKAVAAGDKKLRCSSAGLKDGPEVSALAVRTAKGYDADISDHIPRTVEKRMLSGADAVICMTEEQGDRLADRFPHYDMRIFALGDKDIERPAPDPEDYKRAAGELSEALDGLLAELMEDKK
ncbi:MAG: hypothetical protein IJG63_05305 [Oscillospiraceae bacterium]|nr:hypothetical protein [Oscillospiraceae bacterium]